MSVQAIISMVTILGVVIGGFIYCLTIAMRKEDKHR
ncbi:MULTISPECIES: MetS family NSS transporter small subunit [Reichenbachiella]|nr:MULTISPECIES: MetS family NSS transporter small subunit [Reichenbachiella]MBU2916316.1 MetS family NSS transporter small subunit [Reichenbachiella agariperforans]